MTKNGGNQLQRYVDFYTDTHKGQRLRFSMISKAAGTLNLNDPKGITKFEDELSAFRKNMYFHASLEEKCIHPLLAKRIPGGADKLNDDHRIMHRKFDDLVACFGELKIKPDDFDKRDDNLLEFYRAWSRFISFYFTHIDYEEEYAMPSLWKLCTNDELVEVFKEIMASSTPEESMENLAMMLPAITPMERVDILQQGRAVMPPESFQAALKIAEGVLTPEEFTSLKGALKL